MAERLLKTVFEWDHFSLYLAGSMDFANDGGKGWRDVWTEKLVNIGIKPTQIFNPCKKPFNGAQFDLDDEAAIWRECRKDRDWNRLEDTAGQIMHIDLRLVEKSDIVLVNMPRMPELPEVVEEIAYHNSIYSSDSAPKQLKKMYEKYRSMRVPTYGTIHEIVFANQCKKPIFMVWEDTGLSDCSAWLIKLIGHKNIFKHEDELISHLHKISQGKEAFDANEWLLIDPK